MSNKTLRKMKVISGQIRIDNELKGDFHEVYEIYAFEGEFHVKSNKGLDTQGNGVEGMTLNKAMKYVTDSISTCKIEYEYFNK